MRFERRTFYCVAFSCSIPTYAEIVEDEDDELEKQATFERKYNFRFEEPDEEFVSYSPL